MPRQSQITESLTLKFNQYHILFASTALLYFLREKDLLKLGPLIELEYRGLLIAANANIGLVALHLSRYLKPEIVKDIKFSTLVDLTLNTAVGFAATSAWVATLGEPEGSNKIAADIIITALCITFANFGVPLLKNVPIVSNAIDFDQNYLSNRIAKDGLIASLIGKDPIPNIPTTFFGETLELTFRTIKHFIHYCILCFLDTEFKFMHELTPEGTAAVLGICMLAIATYTRAMDNHHQKYQPAQTQRPDSQGAFEVVVEQDNNSEQVETGGNISSGNDPEHDVVTIDLSSNNDHERSTTVTNNDQTLTSARPIQPIRQTVSNFAGAFAVYGLGMLVDISPHARLSTTLALGALFDISSSEGTRFWTTVGKRLNNSAQSLRNGLTFWQQKENDENNIDQNPLLAQSHSA